VKTELLNIDSLDKSQKEILKIGADKSSVSIMDKKALNIAFKVYDCKFYHANLLKQEALTVGAECAIEKDTITAKTLKSDCLILANMKQAYILSAKLKNQSFKFLRELGVELENQLQNLTKSDFIFRFNNNTIDLKNNIMVIGILNVTDDSFFDGGKYNSLDKALQQTEKMIEEGADIIDIGAESTRPGSLPLELDKELKRIIPVVKEVKKRFTIPISVDTYKSKVAQESIFEGADIINDISGLTFDKNMANVLSESKCGIIAMHIKGTPKNMQKNPQYEHLIYEINEFFKSILEKTDSFNIERNRVILDVGIGFGKTYDDNFKIIDNINSFKIHGRPILIGASRKSFIGAVLNESNPDKRLYGTVGVNVASYLKGARIFRVHDVKANKEALLMAKSINNS